MNEFKFNWLKRKTGDTCIIFVLNIDRRLHIAMCLRVLRDALVSQVEYFRLRRSRATASEMAMVRANRRQIQLGTRFGRSLLALTKALSLAVRVDTWLCEGCYLL